MKIYLPILAFLFFTSSAAAGECDFIQDNKCRSCDVLYGFTVGNEEACSYLCPHREVNYEVSGMTTLISNCVLKQCPKGFPFKSKYGNCFASQTKAEDDYNMREQENSDDDIQHEGYSSAPKAVYGQCPKEFPLLHSGECFSCDEADSLNVSKTECEKCPNRKYNFYPRWDAGRCEIPCPVNKPLRRYDGACFSCHTPKNIALDTHCNFDKDCEVCPNRTILYQSGGNIPSIPNCPDDKPLMDTEGICYACDAPIPVWVEFNQHLCSRACPNQRHVEYKNCVLNESL